MSEETAECRWCGKKLDGKPYYMGVNAYIPETGEQAKINFYGGFVCSEQCDMNCHLEMEGSFPGAGGAKKVSLSGKSKVWKNWS